MTAQTLQLNAFLPKTATAEDYAKIIALQLLSFEERNPGDKLPPEELLQKQFSMLEENPMSIIEVFTLANPAGHLDAVLIMALARPDSPDYEEQKHMGMVNIYVHPAARQKGIGRFLLAKAVENFQAKGITVIQGDTSSDAGRAYAQRFGGTVALESKTSRVQTAEMDWAMVRDWAREGEETNPDVKLELYNGLPPEADLEAYCRLFTELNAQQPLGELEGVETTFTPENMKEMLAQQHERGIEEIVMISREANGAISGVSEISYNPSRPHLVQQGLTGVQMDYRGRSLGKWLKAAMLLHIHQNYPDVQYIDTTNATVNEAMLSINVRLGFKLHRHNSFFKLQVADALQAL